MSLDLYRRALMLEAIGGPVSDKTVQLKRDKIGKDYHSPSDAMLQLQRRASDAVQKNLLGVAAGHDIWIVNGQQLRATIDPDFSNAGNGARLSYIPYTQIWIDDGADIDELAPFIVQHIAECRLMHAGKSYESAHKCALAVSNRLRRVLMAISTRPGVLKSVRLADRYMARFGERFIQSCQA